MGTSFTDLKVWQKTHELVLHIYSLTKKLPADERFALVPQIRRAAVSIAANIAEGNKRRSAKDQVHFYNMADTSLEEVKYYLILSLDLTYVTLEEYKELMQLAEEAGRLLSGLIRSLYKKVAPSQAL